MKKNILRSLVTLYLSQKLIYINLNITNLEKILSNDAFELIWDKCI